MPLPVQALKGRYQGNNRGIFIRQIKQISKQFTKYILLVQSIETAQHNISCAGSTVSASCLRRALVCDFDVYRKVTNSSELVG